MLRKSIYSALAILIHFSLTSQQPCLTHFNCFTVIAGRNATSDGSVLFAHNEDDYGTRIVNWYRVERKIYSAGENLIINDSGAIISQADETNAYLWLDMPEMEFSDSYMNEYGVVIASDQCDSREDDPEITEGGIGYWLRRIIAERARSAKEGVKIGGELITRFGYTYSGRSYFIADPNEAWIMNVVQGKHWVAQRVPDDRVAVVPNYYTISQVNLSDTANFLGSSDLIGYATAKGWYDPGKDGEFSFREAYSAPDKLIHKSNISRRWKGINALSMYEYKREDEFPFAFLPRQKVSLKDLMNLLRDHYEGTPLDLTNGYKSGNPHFTENDPICSPTTQYGFVAQLRNYLPADLGVVLWIAPYRPCIHPFIPWYCGVEEIPQAYQKYPVAEALDHHFKPPEGLYTVDETLAYWYFHSHADGIDKEFGELSGKSRRDSEAFENKYIRKQAVFEKDVLFNDKNDPDAIRREVTGFTLQASTEALKLFK